MSNGPAERIFGTIKKITARLEILDPHNWPTALEVARYGYRHNPRVRGVLPFELMCGVTPHVPQSDPSIFPRSSTLEARHALILPLLVLLERRADHQASASTVFSVFPPAKMIRYMVGYLVLVALGPALTRTMKFPPFTSIFYSPCKVFGANYPPYVLTESTGRVSRSPFHARRFY